MVSRNNIILNIHCELDKINVMIIYYHYHTLTIQIIFSDAKYNHQTLHMRLWDICMPTYQFWFHHIDSHMLDIGFDNQ